MERLRAGRGRVCAVHLGPTRRVDACGSPSRARPTAETQVTREALYFAVCTFCDQILKTMHHALTDPLCTELCVTVLQHVTCTCNGVCAADWAHWGLRGVSTRHAVLFKPYLRPQNETNDTARSRRHRASPSADGPGRGAAPSRSAISRERYSRACSRDMCRTTPTHGTT